MTDTPTRSSSRVTVCGIGASAGGIEALQQFFRALPADLGLAYVVVMHLLRDHHSELASIIGRSTTMSVTQVTDQQSHTLTANHVYVIAPGHKLELRDSSMVSSVVDAAHGHQTAIDRFFCSLAATQPDAFAVVLSGSGSDGAVGAKAVKEAGGIVLVQEPSEAAHDGMPHAAIDTGVADAVSPIGALAARLVELARTRDHMADAVALAHCVDAITAEENAALETVLEVLRARTGHDFSGYKRGTVIRRLSRRMQLANQPTIADYARVLRANTTEVEALFDDLLIPVTTFFRDPAAWAALQHRVIAPLLDRSSPGEPLRVWVPGCATGEEPYSVAIVFREELERRRMGRDVNIFATDLDDAAIATARHGMYSSSITVDVSEKRLDRFFRRDGDFYRVGPEIRSHIVFATHNLLGDPPFSRIDLISCRNVLIYLNRAGQDQVMRKFRNACRHGGFLFVGHSETAASDLFDRVDQQHRIYAVRSEPLARVDDLAVAENGRGGVGVLLPQRRQTRTQAPSVDVHLSALEDVAPPTLVVDEQWNVVHLSSSAARYFQQRGGPPARRLTDLVRLELRDEVHLILDAAFADADPHLSAFVDVSFDDTVRRIGALAQRRVQSQSGSRHVLVTFLDAGPALVTRDDRGRITLHDALHRADQRVERILNDYYERSEDLRESNEELTSLVEECRFTTEELETSKEELRSANEELQAINQELTLRLEEVSRAHSDIENLMAATNVATLFLDRDLRIKRYTPPLAEIFTIKPRDLDRHIGELRHTLDYRNLEQDAERVLATLSTAETHTRSRDGQVYLARINPYRTTHDRRVDGVVVTFVDVTHVERAETAVNESRVSRAETSEVRELLARLVHVQEEERRRIARDIHDQMGQQMTALRLQIDSLRLQTGATPNLVSRFSRIEALASELDESMDFLTWELRPAALDLLGLPAALGELVQGWSHRFGVPANYHAVATDVAVASETASNLYRIVQEALHNIYKHAHATNVSVLLDAHDGTLTVCIEDDGCGFTTGDSPDVAHTHNLGLISMRERTKLIGGEVDIDSAPGQGTSISVHVPLGTSDTESLQRVR